MHTKLGILQLLYCSTVFFFTNQDNTIQTPILLVAFRWITTNLHLFSFSVYWTHTQKKEQIHTELKKRERERDNKNILFISYMIKKNNINRPLFLYSALC